MAKSIPHRTVARTTAGLLVLLIGLTLITLLSAQKSAYAHTAPPPAPQGYEFYGLRCQTPSGVDSFRRQRPFWKVIELGPGTGDYAYCNGIHFGSGERYVVVAEYSPLANSECVDFRYPYRVIDKHGVHLYTIELYDRPCADGTHVWFDRDTADYRTYKVPGVKLDIAGDGGGANCLSSRTEHELKRTDWIEGRCSYKISTTNSATYTFSAGGGFGGIDVGGGAEITLGPEIQHMYHSLKFTPNRCVYVSGVDDGAAKCW